MELGMNVLFRFSQKTGKVDTTMTGLGSAMMRMWALNNTTKTKACMIVEQSTGRVLLITQGTADGWPKIRDGKKEDLGTCEAYGIPLMAVQSIKDDRF